MHMPLLWSCSLGFILEAAKSIYSANFLRKTKFFSASIKVDSTKNNAEGKHKVLVKFFVFCLCLFRILEEEYYGHRKRLRERFLKSKFCGFADDEVIE
jgi:hypothetical protein